MLLNDKLSGWQVILGSNSPRRRELLAGCGIGFEQGVPFAVDESVPEGMSAREAARYLSDKKSGAYPQPLGEKDILITADTVVIVDDAILGKPSDAAHAARMLRMLSGRSHSVVTGCTLRSASRKESFDVETAVTFSTLTDEQIAYYIGHYKPFDKAGAYGIQEWIGYMAVSAIEGSFYNVMGLPVHALCARLEAFAG